MEENKHAILPEKVSWNSTDKIYTTLINQGIGDEIVFPIERVFTIRSYCSQLGLAYQRKYETKSNRKDRIVSVKRIS